MTSHAEARATLVRAMSAAPQAEPVPPIEGTAAKLFRDDADAMFEWVSTGAQDLDHMGAMVTLACEFLARELEHYLPTREAKLDLRDVRNAYIAINADAIREVSRRERKRRGA